jgi:hypothetical protein
MLERRKLVASLRIVFLSIFPIILFAYFNPAAAATITVTNTDDNGAGSLRQAIINAVSGDTINFSITGTITLTSGELLINKNLTINGPGASVLAISGNNSSRIFNITAGDVLVTGITIQDGNPGSGSNGGGILVRNNTNLTISNSVIRDNEAGVGGGI